MTDVPYYLTEEFCKEHGRKGPSQLAREFPETGRSSWQNRRVEMQHRYPELVPFLDRQARPLDGRTVQPDMVTGTKSHADAETERAETHTDTVEILDGGNAYCSTKLLELNDEQSKSPDYLLTAHGFSPAEWEIVNAKNAIWNVASKRKGEDGHNVSTLYSSRVTVRPLQSRIDMAAIAEAVCAVVTPVEIPQPKHGERLLELSHTDLHFGNSTAEWYADTLARTVHHLRRGGWAEVVIPIGSDLFHCDNFKNTTANGTPQSSVNWPEAWADALSFYSTIFEVALLQSVDVHAFYIIGNHDESMAWAFCQMLAAKYPQVHFDLGIDERKAHRFYNVAIGMTHGAGPNRKNLDRIFMSEFPEFACATIREVHAGHYHHEVTVDEFGVVVRSLSTAARTDKWHRENGYVGACKRFMLFEFSGDALEGVHYV